MAKLVLSSKRLQVNKSNATISLIIGLASFFVVFSLIGARGLLVRSSYQSGVIEEKEKAADQLKANIESVDQLLSAYQEFVQEPVNIIGGTAVGTGDRDGDNARIILDALPSSYDYPALTTSLEKMVTSQGLKFDNITGIDDEVAQAEPDTENKPIEMPFEIAVMGGYDSQTRLIDLFDRSIRPLKTSVLTLTAEGEGGEVKLEIKGTSYYVPEKKLNITKKDVDR